MHLTCKEHSGRITLPQSLNMFPLESATENLEDRRGSYSTSACWELNKASRRIILVIDLKIVAPKLEK